LLGARQKEWLLPLVTYISMQKITFLDLVWFVK